MIDIKDNLQAMNIKAKLTKYILVVIAVVAIFSCEAEYTTYEGPELVQFTDTTTILAIIDSEQFHDINIASSKAVGYDRNYAVRIVAEETNAIEGVHFDIENFTATIKAGEHVASVKIKCYHDKIEDQDSLGITLTLLNQEDEFDIRGHKAHVVFKRVCNFDFDNFTGYCIVTSQFLDNYSRQRMRLCKAVKDPSEKQGIIIEDYLQDGYNIKLRFNTEEPLEPYVEMDANQMIAKASGFFNHIYQDDKLLVYQPDNYPSIFNSCGEYVVQYSVFHIANEGTIGIFRTVILWISDAEADYLISQGY